jgi:3-hydroxyacyl-[acyl-carrier-protein] dehydratase
MLLQDFFKIINADITDNAALVEVELNPQHAIFQGHFPGHPITPGVCVNQIAVDLFSHIQQQEYAMTKAKSVKFIHIIKPEENPRVHYQLNWMQVTEQQYKIEALVYHEDTTFAKINITVETES